MITAQPAARILDRLRDVYGEPARRASEDPVRGLVGTILSQNTSDINSERALQNLTDEFPSWDAVLAAGIEEIEAAIRSGGLARQKAPTILRALSAIVKKSGTIDADFLDDLTDDEAMAFLTGIKGVGQKTAACVLLFDLDRDVIPVDTHVHRVTRRLGLVPASADPIRTQTVLEDQIAPDDRYAAHVLFIQHGRSICHARRPNCDACAVANLCDFASTAQAAEESA